MATRFYLPSSGTPPVTPGTPTGWTQTTGWAAFPAVTAKTDTGLFNGSAVTELVGTQLDRVYVSDPIPAQTVSGTFSMVLTTSESSSTGDLWLDVHIKIVSNNGATVRGTLYAGSTASAVSATVGDENEEMATSGQTRIKNAIALTSVVAQANDRIVFEIGAKASAAATRTSTRRYGDPIATADYALTSGLASSAGDPWIELSADVMSVGFAGSLSTSGSGTTSFGGVSNPAGSLSTSGSGTVGFGGAANPAGSLARTGSGALSLAASAVKAAGVLAVTGSGALTLSGKPAVNVDLARSGSGALTLVGLPAFSFTLVRTGSGTLTLVGRAIYRHQMWDGVKWTEIVPLVWDGGAWLTNVPVKLVAGLRSA